VADADRRGVVGAGPGRSASRCTTRGGTPTWPARRRSSTCRPLLSICPPAWPERRKLEVAQLILATLRGFLIEWRTSGDGAGIEAGLSALVRALEREESASD